MTSVQPGTRPCGACGVMLTAAEYEESSCPVCGGPTDGSGMVWSQDDVAAKLIFVLRRIASAIEATAGPPDDDDDEPETREPWQPPPRRRRQS